MSHGRSDTGRGYLDLCYGCLSTSREPRRAPGGPTPAGPRADPARSGECAGIPAASRRSPALAWARARPSRASMLPGFRASTALLGLPEALGEPEAKRPPGAIEGHRAPILLERPVLFTLPSNASPAPKCPSDYGAPDCTFQCRGVLFRSASSDDAAAKTWS